jgi:hypothetical protein
MPNLRICVSTIAACLVFTPLPGHAQPIALQRLAVAAPEVALSVGEITDAVADGTRIVVASERDGRLLVLSPDLTIRSRAGRRGSGPGEFRELRAVRRTPDGRVQALDRALRRLYRYRWERDSLRLEKTIALPLDAYDFIPLADGGAWVLGPHAGARLHRIAADGRVLESRWPLPTGAPTAIGVQLAQDGWMEWNDDSFLVVSPYVAGTLTVPERKNAPTQVDSLTGFRAVTVEPFRGGVTVSSGPKGACAPLRPARLPDGRWLVQATVASRMDGGDERPLQWASARATIKWLGPQVADYRLLPLSNGEVLVQYEDDNGTIARAKLQPSPPAGRRAK